MSKSSGVPTKIIIGNPCAYCGKRRSLIGWTMQAMSSKTDEVAIIEQTDLEPVESRSISRSVPASLIDLHLAIQSGLLLPTPDNLQLILELIDAAIERPNN